MDNRLGSAWECSSYKGSQLLTLSTLRPGTWKTDISASVFISPVAKEVFQIHIAKMAYDWKENKKGIQRRCQSTNTWNKKKSRALRGGLLQDRTIESNLKHAKGDSCHLERCEERRPSKRESCNLSSSAITTRKQLVHSSCKGSKINRPSRTSLEVHRRCWSPNNRRIGCLCWIWIVLS